MWWAVQLWFNNILQIVKLSISLYWHFIVLWNYRPSLVQLTCVSSLKSPQSLSPSQAQCPGIHRPLAHLNWSSMQECTQSASSLLSPQSSSGKKHQKLVKTNLEEHFSYVYHIFCAEFAYGFGKGKIHSWATSPTNSQLVSFYTDSISLLV